MDSIQFSPIILLQNLVRKSTEEKSWFWSIDAIAGEHHLPVKIYGPLQKGYLDVREGCLVWKSTEEKSWFWSIDAIAGEHHLPVKIYGPLQRDIWTLVWKSTEENLGSGALMPLLANIIFQSRFMDNFKSISGRKRRMVKEKQSCVGERYQYMSHLQTLFWKSTEEKSWFWSIDAIAGEHHLPVKIYGPLQKDIWTLVWKRTEEKSWFWSIDDIAGEHHIQSRFMDHFRRISGRKEKDGKKKSNHVLGRGTSKCLICKRKKRKRREKKSWFFQPGWLVKKMPPWYRKGSSLATEIKTYDQSGKSVRNGARKNTFRF
ncbi:hypothetical protein CEXT_391261 [Caerostris extrusa]|uniref:Uncharacterized protein n=1 Tax=Caerostris extrusa TaxID=172846 RepID=A0AAV4VV19_CAEEX|nr:hypothetical protein CEXT_391261 [Caerostris extrusa]